MPIQPAFGTKDLNPKEVEQNQQISAKLSSLYVKWGYQEVYPPKVERIETLVAGGGISNKDIVKLVAEEPLGLRPELTASIARASATRFAHIQRPLRLWATGTVFKNKEDCDLKLTIEESLNSGVELIGMHGMEAEIELLYLLLEALNILEIDLEEKPTLLIGHKRLMKLILEDFTPKEQLVIKKNLTSYDLIKTEDLEITDKAKQKLIKVLKIRGNPKKVIHELEDIYGVNEIFVELQRLFSIIDPIASKHNVSIQLDPTYQSDYDFYTGIIFQLICKNIFAPKIIARGGRYDDLINMFGQRNRNEKAAGFSFSLDRIRELKQKTKHITTSKFKTLIVYSLNKMYEDALQEQLNLHSKGITAMVELEPCDSKESAKQLMVKRGFDKLLWIG